MMRPLPSRSPGIPPIFETKMYPDAVSTYTLSGASTPSVTVQPAMTRPDVAGAGVAGAPGVEVVGFSWGAGLQAGRPMLKPQADWPIPETMTSRRRFQWTYINEDLLY